MISINTYFLKICAPSNTAIDEIILRIQQKGLYGENGEQIKPKIVRVGILDNDPHELVKQCALENLAQKEMTKGQAAKNPKVLIQRNFFLDKIRKKQLRMS